MDAAERLLEERPPSAISITEVVATAEMSRPTFYQYFPDTGAAFAAAALRRVEAVVADLPVPEVGDPSQGMERAFAQLVDRMGADATFYSRVHDSSGGIAFHGRAIATVAEWLRSLPSPAVPDETTAEFLAGGIVWTLTRHLAALCADPEYAPAEPDLGLARMVSASPPAPAEA